MRVIFQDRRVFGSRVRQATAVVEGDAPHVVNNTNALALDKKSAGTHARDRLRDTVRGRLGRDRPTTQTGRRDQKDAPAAKDDDSKPKAKAKAEDAADEPEKSADESADIAEKPKAEPGKAIEIPPDPDTFLDSRAKNLMANEYTELFRTDLMLPDQYYRAVLTMANGTANIDKATIDKFVHHEAAQLSSRKNIDALMSPPGTKPKSGGDPLAIGQAAFELMEPLRGAGNNQAFRRVYIAAFLAKDVVPKLLAGHLFTRTQAMLVLSKSADLSAMDTFVSALKDPEQPLSVKILAANGISNVTRKGRRPFEGTQGFQIAQAVVGFLEGDAKEYWPAEIAALEALGSLRLLTVNQNKAEFEIAVAAAKLLEDPKGRPDVRAWAAWAVGMTRIVGPSADQFNFILVAHDMGELAATMGSSILAANMAVNNTKEKTKPPANLANDLTALLYYRVFRGLSREPEITDSGLVHSGVPQSQSRNGPRHREGGPSGDGRGGRALSGGRLANPSAPKRPSRQDRPPEENARGVDAENTDVREQQTLKPEGPSR